MKPQTVGVPSGARLPRSPERSNGANLWWSSYGTVIRVPDARQGDDEPSHRSPELIDAPHA
jgi:hypothetical protein